MSILLQHFKSIKHYVTSIEHASIDVACPCCDRRLWKHGSYQRTVHYKHQSYVIPILRFRCPDCKKTHALIPCFIKPWARFANHIWEFLGRYLLEGIPMCQLPELLSSERTSIISLKTIYRWTAQIKERTSSWRKEQRFSFLCDEGAGDSLLALYRHGMRTDEEWVFFLFHFFEGNIPKRGSIFTHINLQLPSPRYW